MPLAGMGVLTGDKLSSARLLLSIDLVNCRVEESYRETQYTQDRATHNANTYRVYREHVRQPL